MQVVVPIAEHAEMDFNILKVVERMKKDSNYVKQSWECYGREIDPFVINRSIANFERTLFSGNSRYDQYTFQNNKNAMNSKELKGLELFNSDRTNCSTCHSGFNFTNYKFENNGLYESYEDPLCHPLTLNEVDRALFKIPSLRNVEKTAPYMIDGSVATLEEVIEHYNSGGKDHPPIKVRWFVL